MYLLRVIYSWSDRGNPDATPTGIHALDFEGIAIYSAEEALKFANAEGLCDDTVWLFANNEAEAKLIVKKDKHGYWHCLENNYWVPSFIGEAVCKSKAFKTVYVNIQQYVAELELDREDIDEY